METGDVAGSSNASGFVVRNGQMTQVAPRAARRPGINDADNIVGDWIRAPT